MSPNKYNLGIEFKPWQRHNLKLHTLNEIVLFPSNLGEKIPRIIQSAS